MECSFNEVDRTILTGGEKNPKTWTNIYHVFNILCFDKQTETVLHCNLDFSLLNVNEQIG